MESFERMHSNLATISVIDFSKSAPDESVARRGISQDGGVVIRPSSRIKPGSAKERRADEIRRVSSAG
jgi:hypothetical protein